MSSRSSCVALCVICLSEWVSADCLCFIFCCGACCWDSVESRCRNKTTNNTHLQPSLSPRSPQCCAGRTHQWKSTFVSVLPHMYSTHQNEISNKLAPSKYAIPVLHCVLFHTSPAKSKVVSARSRSDYLVLDAPLQSLLKYSWSQLVFSKSAGT